MGGEGGLVDLRRDMNDKKREVHCNIPTPKVSSSTHVIEATKHSTHFLEQGSLYVPTTPTTTLWS